MYLNQTGYQVQAKTTIADDISKKTGEEIVQQILDVIAENETRYPGSNLDLQMYFVFEPHVKTLSVYRDGNNKWKATFSNTKSVTPAKPSVYGSWYNNSNGTLRQNSRSTKFETKIMQFIIDFVDLDVIP